MFTIEVLILFLTLSFLISDSLQAPRFITKPSASGSIVAEGRTKILQCQALGKNYAFALGKTYA